jgi:NAD(P)-dependent dehydrogenase (short-subunit alcohol dehydrogenase family)
VSDTLNNLFSLQGKVAAVTGGTGVLGGAMARGLALAGARIGILGRRAEQAERAVAAITALGGEAIHLAADVLDRGQLEAARDAALARWGRIDILVNAAGGNVAAATVVGEQTFFDLPRAALEQVIDLNLLGTLLPSQVFGAAMARAGSGCVINISSAAAQRPLTRVVGYAAAKAAVENFTRWLAVELASKYGERLRVNAIVPGFFLGEQNRAMLLSPDGSPTERGRLIIAHTPMARFGEPDDLVGTLIWLCSDAARFVTGVSVPVDGGFSAWNGV